MKKRTPLMKSSLVPTWARMPRCALRREMVRLAWLYSPNW